MMKSVTFRKKSAKVWLGALALTFTCSLSQARECIQNQHQINSSPKIKKIVDSMGGFNKLQGTWNYKLMGITAASVVLAGMPEGLRIRISGFKYVPVQICTSSVAGTLEAFFTNPEDNTPESVRIHPMANGQIGIAAARTSWQPKKFAKADPTGPETTIAVSRPESSTIGRR